MLVDFIQNTIDGLMTGSSYAMLALGFTLIFGVLRRANLAYGPAIMFGAYGATLLSLHFQAGFILLALATMAGAVLGGAYVERLCFAPYGRRTGGGPARGIAIASMVASFALWMQFEELVTIVLPNHLYAFPAMYGGPALTFGPFAVRVEYVAMLVVAVLICVSLHALLYRTRFGLGVRAVIDSADAARCVGINVANLFMRVFALASAIGGVAGYLLVATHEQITPMLGMWSTLKGMIAMMLGGLGSLPGAVAGGLALGLIEAHSQWYLGPQYRDLLTYFILFVCLWLRPAGLFVPARGGRPTRAYT